MTWPLRSPEWKRPPQKRNKDRKNTPVWNVFHTGVFFAAITCSALFMGVFLSFGWKGAPPPRGPCRAGPGFLRRKPEKERRGCGPWTPEVRGGGSSPHTPLLWLRAAVSRRRKPGWPAARFRSVVTPPPTRWAAGESRIGRGGIPPCGGNLRRGCYSALSSSSGRGMGPC